MRISLKTAALSLAAVLLGAAGSPAGPAAYVQVCTAPCVARDGSTQPAGTVLNRAVWIDVPAPDAATAWQPDAGQITYQPAPPQAATGDPAHAGP